jgi:nucleotide-binding universal stress UspA family protein
MIQSILLAIDASEYARIATSYANFLAYKFDATLDAVYVIDRRLTNMTYWIDYGALSIPASRFSEEMEQVLTVHGEALLEQVKEKAAKAEVRHRVELHSGLPAQKIVEAAKDCDLIVLGRCGESGSLGDGLGLGAVAERVLRSARQPVLSTPSTFQGIERVVLGFDGSSRAQSAMRYALELAKRLDLGVLALSVDQDEAVNARRLEIVRHYAEPFELELATRSFSGDPVEEILNQLEKGDVIAIGAFGEGRMREWLLGSTTEAILRRADYPVLLHR